MISPLQKYEATALLFDIDGTLIDSNDQHARAFCQALDRSGYRVSYSAVRRLIGMGGEKLIPQAVGRELPEEEVTAIGDLKKKIFFEDFFSEVRPFPQTPELLRCLTQSGCPLAVATSASRQELDHLLKIKPDLTRYFSVLACGDDVSRAKPAPDIIQVALSQLQVPAKKALMVGDTPYDIEAAQRAGVRTIAFLSGGWSREDLEGAIGFFSDPADLLAWWFPHS